MKTKLFFLTILFSFSLSNVKAQCPSGDVNFLYQQDVDNFLQNYPNCSHITGRLFIGEFNNWQNTIDNISGLSNITTVDGHLGIYNSKLIDLNGLQNLNYVGGGILIDQNYELLSISQLSNLTQVNGRLEIGENINLLNLNGLENITTIESHLRVLYNDKIESIESLNNITYVGGFLGINVNPLLESLTGLDNMCMLKSIF